MKIINKSSCLKWLRIKNSIKLKLFFTIYLFSTIFNALKWSSLLEKISKFAPIFLNMIISSSNSGTYTHTLKHFNASIHLPTRTKHAHYWKQAQTYTLLQASKLSFFLSLSLNYTHTHAHTHTHTHIIQIRHIRPFSRKQSYTHTFTYTLSIKVSTDTQFLKQSQSHTLLIWST